MPKNMNHLDEWHMNTRRLGRRVLVHNLLDSTNTAAAELAADPANEGVVVIARSQSAGRGQHGRSWQCPPGSGVLLSVLLFPPTPLRRPALLTAWAAVSVCETILYFTGLQAKIKWPNDVLIRGKKVCGILMEQSLGTVAGIGLNVNQDAQSLACAGLTAAGSLALLSGLNFNCDEVARRLIIQLDEEYDRLCQGELGVLETCWKWRMGLLGKRVAVECLEGGHLGRLLDLTFDGLELEVSTGRTLRLKPESVRHISTLT
jgi:BirA family biotin operon repressor/biotin-[acetyl-CoA-carboxylase] ligase